jgi:Ca-activated chloride channel family protein
MHRRRLWPFALVPALIVPALLGAGCARDRAPAEGKAEEGRPAFVPATSAAEDDPTDFGQANEPRTSAASKRSAAASAAQPPAAPAATAAQPPSARRDVGGDDRIGKGIGGLGKNKQKEGGERASGEKLGDMYFQHYGVNPTVETSEEPNSTFSVDVDSASYSMVRSLLEGGSLPPEAAVRVEELVNAFDYGYAAPEDGAFAIHAEAAPSPNRRGYHVLHVGLKGREVHASQRKAANLVFVLDVSGSMQGEGRLGLLKRSLRLLVDRLDEGDKVGIVSFSDQARLVLPPTTAHRRHDILRAIDGLATEGGTNAEAGLRMGYRMASEIFRPDAVNRVLLCSDGVANAGLTDAAGLTAMLQRDAARGITLTTVGIGMGNYNDVLLEQLAQRGQGNYHYVDKLDQARRVFVDQMVGTLQVVARDAKIQVAFDPKVVARYRLLGYENRALSSAQFADDRVDAGEVGAGHTVTAVYEVKLHAGASSEAPLAEVRVRYKDPEGGASRLIERAVPRSVVRASTAEMSSPTRLALAVALFAEKLRGSYWARNVRYEDALTLIDGLSGSLRERAEIGELRGLVERARGLDKRGDKFERELPLARMDFDHVPVLLK